MKLLKSIPAGAVIVITLLIVLTGVALALVQITRDVPASVDINVVSPEGIEIYLDEALTIVAGPINFGTVDVDAFGTPVADFSVLVWVKNISLSGIRLTLSDDLAEADIYFVGDEPEPLVAPGEVLAGTLALRDINPSGGFFDFTVTFGAEGPVPVAQPGLGQTLTVLFFDFFDDLA